MAREESRLARPLCRLSRLRSDSSAQQHTGFYWYPFCSVSLLAADLSKGAVDFEQWTKQPYSFLGIPRRDRSLSTLMAPLSLRQSRDETHGRDMANPDLPPGCEG